MNVMLHNTRSEIVQMSFHTLNIYIFKMKSKCKAIFSKM